jgi:hypothetical protein
MPQNAEYKVIQTATAMQMTGELTQLALHGWKPILMTTTHAAGAAGIGNIVITVIVEHVLGT